MIYALVTAVAGASAILCVTVWLTTRRNVEADEVARRLTAYSAAPAPPPRPSTGNVLRDGVNSVVDAMGPLFARSSYAGKLADDLQKADLRMKSSEWILLVFISDFIISGLITLRFAGSVPAQIDPLIFVGSFTILYFISGFYLRFRQRRRGRQFANQLGETIILLSNALKAGLSFAQAMATVAKNASPPISEEFARGTREIGLGINVDDALSHMVERNRSEDFDLLVTAVQIQRVVGGNLAEILDTIAFTIRERVRIQGEIRTLTAQARISGIIITLLPIGLALFLLFTQPGYFGSMVTDPVGIVMLVVGLCSIALGWAVIQKIVNIEV